MCILSQFFFFFKEEFPLWVCGLRTRLVSMRCGFDSWPRCSVGEGSGIVSVGHRFGYVVWQLQLQFNP